jgi:signal transduction histidine kinase
MNLFVKKFDSLSKWGIPKSASPIHQLQYQIVNMVGFIVAGALLATIVVHGVTANWQNVAINLITLLFVVPIFLCVHRDLFNSARIYLLAFANGVIFFFAGQVSIQYEFHILFFAVAILPFVLFGSDEKIGRILGAASSILLFFSLSLYNFKLPWSFDLPLPTWSPEATYAITFAIILTAEWMIIRSHDLTLKFLDDERTRMINTEKLVSLGELSSSLAHELKNPLAVIVSRTSLLLERLSIGAMSNEDLEKSLRVILRTSGRIDQTIKSIQALSRDSTRDPLSPIPLKTLLDDVSILLDHKIKSKEVELRINSYESSWQLMGRESQLVQVMMNLISNAIDAVETLPARWIEIAFLREEEHFLIQVKDSGTGIPPDVVEKIMNPFFTTKTSGKGTGLGLSISRRIMQDHQGDLRYISNLGNTVFQMQFPRSSLVSPLNQDEDRKVS